MSLALGYAFNVQDIFQNFDLKRLQISCNDCEKLTADRHRNRLAAKIFRENLKMVLEDIIDHNITFELPCGRKKADIHMKLFTGEEFKKCRQNGKFQEIDFLKTYFTAYQPYLYLYSNNRTRKKPIYVNEELKQKIINNTNSGMKYC